MTTVDEPRPLRSQQWWDNPGNPEMTALYLERFLNFGLTRGELQSGRPIIGIAQTGSDLVPCNRHHLQLADRVRAGVRDAGGIPLEFPVHPLQETGKRPTAALDRNLAYLGLVEVLYGYPLDGVVLTTGCDKTTPACLMAAATVNLPAIVLSGVPMLNGYVDGRRAGSAAGVSLAAIGYHFGTTGALLSEAMFRAVQLWGEELERTLVHDGDQSQPAESRRAAIWQRVIASVRANPALWSVQFELVVAMQREPELGQHLLAAQVEAREALAMLFEGIDPAASPQQAERVGAYYQALLTGVIVQQLVDRPMPWARPTCPTAARRRNRGQPNRNGAADGTQQLAARVFA